VTDPNGLFHSKQFTIKILNVNDRPSNITLSGDDTGYVDENANNALVGDLAAVDEDANQLHTFKLVNNSGWKFVLKGSKVYTSRYANIDFEKQSAFTIVVRAIDNGRPSLFLDISFVVQVIVYRLAFFFHFHSLFFLLLSPFHSLSSFFFFSSYFFVS
jgi:hypothetical protein